MRKLVGLIVVVSVVGCLCGLPGIAAEEATPRDPLLMGVASFLVPGLGQFIQGDTDTALTHFLVALVIPVAGGYLAIASPAPSLVSVAAGIAQLSWAFYSATDSYKMAVEYNEEHGFSLGFETRFSLSETEGSS